VLKVLGIDNYLIHLNEGHASFALLERIRGHMQRGSKFAAACQKVIDSTIFTTHTPVPAGHDIFHFQLIGKYFDSYWPALGRWRGQLIRNACRRRLPGPLGPYARFCPQVRHLQKSPVNISGFGAPEKTLQGPLATHTDHLCRKAHPADNPGKVILQNLINLSRDPRIGGRVAFVEDYGKQLAQYLVHGVDVWLNNPLPPFEACGTSGMKAALNGVPHLSALDGWWVEGFYGNNGWALNHDASSANPDGSDAEKLYRILEDEIIPLYYTMSENSIPHKWVALMKESIKGNAAVFSARRMVKQYIEKFYAGSMKNALEE
jgi:glucan phosphorylase